MSDRNRKPLNGNGFNGSTSRRGNDTPDKPIGAERSEQIAETEVKVNKAIHGLVFNLLPDPSAPGSWSESVLGQVLGSKDNKDNFINEALKKYLEKVASGEIEMTKGGEAKSTFAKSPEKILGDTASEVLVKRLKETKQVQALTSELGNLAKLYGAEIKDIFVNKEWTKIFLVVATGLAAGGAVAGLVYVAHETKNDMLGSAATGLANLIPEKLIEVGDLKRNMTVGFGGVEWTPSKGTWKASAYVAGEWNTASVKFKGRVEVSGSDKGTEGKAQVGASYLIGKAYLDSIDAEANGHTNGNYDLSIKLVKTIAGNDNAKFSAFVGAKYSGSFRGDPAPDSIPGGSVTAGFKLTFGGP